MEEETQNALAAEMHVANITTWRGGSTTCCSRH